MLFSAFISHLETNLFYRWQTGEKAAGRTLGRFFWNFHYLRKFELLALPEAKSIPPHEAPLHAPNIMHLVTSDTVPPTSLTDLLRDEDNRLYAARKLRNSLNNTLNEINEEIKQLNAQKRRKNKCQRYASLGLTPTRKQKTHVPHLSVRRKSVNE